MDMNNPQLLHGLYDSQISRTKAIGYCKRHCAALTAKTLKQHECLKKQCNALKKYPEHSFWIERQVMKERRKANKINGGLN